LSLPSDSTIVHPPRAKYAVIMALATAAAALIGVGVTMGMRAPLDVVLAVVGVAVAGAFVTFLPALLNISKEMWGVAVLGSSMGRAILILGLTLAIDKVRTSTDGHAALWIGAVCGAGVVLVVEAAAAVRILSTMDKAARA